jgi:purine-binding chemotaxis protein CheW
MSMTSTLAADPSAAARRAEKYLTFYLAGEEYGLEILKVHEIMGMLPVTRVPRTPESVRGVINLRGKVIPIVDLRRKFRMAHDGTEETCIIVVEVRGIQIGIVVDRVSEVLSIAAGDVEPPPEFGADVDTRYLLGLAKTDGRVRLLLNIDCVLSNDEVAELAPAEAPPTT